MIEREEEKKVENQSKTFKILIAEDDGASMMYLKMVLNTYSKEFLIAGTGVDAVETCRSNPNIDLILMDIQMPVMDGYEATRQIRLLNKDVIIIAQTAFALMGDRKLAIAAGCNDYISKPINRNLLIGLVRKYLMFQLD